MDTAMRGCDAGSFDALYKAVIAQYGKEAAEMARYHRQIIDTHNENNAFLMSSLLINDCIQRGKPLLNGGARYNGAVLMGHGFTNTANALTAVKQLVFEDKTLSLAEIFRALDADFNGFEDIRKALINAPKYGNDHEAADAMVSNLWRDISRVTKDAGIAQGFDFLTVSSVNPGGYDMGKIMGAPTPSATHPRRARIKTA
jgi:pyruvate-formate lyase